MATVRDYLRWRGDLRFSQDAFNDVDALVLAMLSYLPFDDIISGDGAKGFITIQEAAGRLPARNQPGKKEPAVIEPAVHPAAYEDLLELIGEAAQSVRFADIQLSRFERKTDFTLGEQFAALTYHLPDAKRRKVIAFRGTDNTLIGWKEDFEMAYMQQIPAQESARGYLKGGMDIFSGGITVCGHSKGGNLAVYAASRLNWLERWKVSRIINFDGPGFDFSLASSVPFSKCAPKVVNYVPEESIVGMLLEPVCDRHVIASGAHGISQHDALNWEVQGREFIHGELSTPTLLLEETLKSWLAQISIEKRKVFIEALFDILGASEGKTTDPMEHIRDISKIVKDFSQLDEGTKNLLAEVFSAFTNQARSTISRALKEKLAKEKKDGREVALQV